MIDSRSVLVLAHRIPYPPDKGDKIRSYHMVTHLAERGWNVHLLSLADDPADLAWASELSKRFASFAGRPLDRFRKKLWSLTGPPRGKPLSVPYFYDRRMQQDFDRALAHLRPDAVLCVCSPMAEYVFHSGVAGWGAGQRPRLLIDFMDVDSDKWAQYALKTPGPLGWVYRLESRLLARYEQRVAETFDATLLVSPAEAELFRRRTGLEGKIHAVGNGVDLEFFRPLAPAPARRGGEPLRLVFCGAMDYLPNVDAVTWFAREVLPLVRERAGDVGFTIVGSNPAPEVQSLGSIPGVRVTGRVADVRPHVWEADVSVAPIRIARGVQNKVLEAMAMGVPVVATPEAFEGIDAAPGTELVVCAAEAASFAEGVAALLGDRAARESLGARARAGVEARYAWAAQLAELEPLLGR